MNGMGTLTRIETLSPIVREVGIQRRDSWRTRPRRIYDHQFLYCFTGSVHLVINQNHYLLTQGSVAIIPPNKPHTIWVDENAEGDLYWFHCDFMPVQDGNWVYEFYNTPEKYAKLFGGAMPYPEHIRPALALPGNTRLEEHIAFSDYDEIELVFRTLYKLYTRLDSRFPIRSKILVLQLLEAIFEKLHVFSASRDEDRRVSNSIHTYIKANYYRKISVYDICKYANLNSDYAGKLFKKETGMTLIEYLNKFRIEKAKRLLLDEDLSIVDVAEMTGFQNENYFCSITRKHTGMTPTRLRRHMRQLTGRETEDALPETH